MYRSAILLVAVLLLGGCYVAEPRPSESTIGRAESAGVASTGSTAELPPDVLALCADANGRIASAEEPWIPGDFIWDASLPRNRLIWAAIVDPTYVVHFEQGGFAHTYRVLVLRRAANRSLEVVLRAETGRLKDYAHYEQVLRDGGFGHAGRYDALSQPAVE